MSKNREQKRKMQLETRAKNESFCFQVEFLCEKKDFNITEWKQELRAELNDICQNGITDALSNLALIIEGVQKELGYVQEVAKCSLNGTLVPFILGITPIQPDKATYVQGILAEETPIQVKIAYDNEIRNRVVDWVKERYDNVTTRLSQPILKLPNMIVEFKRVVKD